MKTFKQLLSIIKEDVTDSSDAFNALKVLDDHLSFKDSCYVTYFYWSSLARYAVFDTDYQNFIKLKDGAMVSRIFPEKYQQIIRDIYHECETDLSDVQITHLLKNSAVLVLDFEPRGQRTGKVIVGLDRDKVAAKQSEILNDKELIETEIKKIPNWKTLVTRLEVANEQTEESDSFESMFTALDDVYDDYIERGIVPLQDVPNDKLDEYFRKKGIKININNNKQTGLQILKKIKPRGIFASGYLQKFGKPINLKIGKFKILNQKCYVFNYDFAKEYKILSKPTIQNLEILKRHFKFNHKTVYVTLSYALVGDWGARYTFVITGERNGIPYAYLRKETANPAAGQTKLYGPKSWVRASHITWPSYRYYRELIQRHPELQERLPRRFEYEDYVQYTIQNGFSGEDLQTREQQLKDIGL